MAFVLYFINMKTNKAVNSRIRKTKKSKMVVSGKGRGHFNAKHPRAKKLDQKRKVALTLSKKIQQRFKMYG